MRIRFFSGVVPFCLLLLGAGCLPVPVLPVAPTLSPPTASSTALMWEEVGVGMDRAEAVFSSTTGATIIFYRLSPKDVKAEFLHSLPPKHLSVWGAEATNTALLVNGVYFHEDYLPSGFLRIQGTKIGTRQFDQDKSGVILSHPLRLIDTKKQPIKLDGVADAAQSYPFLLKNGMLAVAEESGKVARRTFLGLDREGFIYVGVAPYVPLSLYQLGQFLRDAPISWTHVLNLDGGPSTGLWAKHGGKTELFDSYVPVPNILRFRTLH